MGNDTHPADSEQARRFLAGCRLRRHGWARFQAGARRAAERQARKLSEQQQRKRDVRRNA